MPGDANDDVGSGCLLLSHLRCTDDSAQLMLDYSTRATPATDDDDAVVPSSATTAINIQPLKGYFECRMDCMVPTVMESHGILASHGKSWKMERVMEKSWNFKHLFSEKNY